MTEKTAREAAVILAEKILDEKEYSHTALHGFLDRASWMSRQDRAFLSRIVTGTVEQRLFLDYAIDQVSKVKTQKMKPFIRAVLRTAAYQIFFMDGVADRAACSESVNLVKKSRLHNLSGFVNGVLRSLIREKEGISDLTGIQDKTRAMSLGYSMPEWIIKEWQGMFSGDVTERILKSISEESPVVVRVNTSLASVGQVRKSLEARGVKGEAGPYFSSSLILSGFSRLEELECFQKGWIQVQDTSSQLVGYLAAPKEGSRIIDVCAAPGGKTLHAADLLRGTGKVTACDLSEEKVRLIRDNVRRIGFQNIEPVVHDALQSNPAWEETADLVIADLPCSGLGVMGRKPDIRYRMTKEQIVALQKLQREMLAVVSGYVKPGGRLIYSTCTITREENVENVRWIATRLSFQPMDLSEALPEGLSATLAKGRERDTAKEGYVQLLPGVHPCDGFFVSMFRKIK